MRTDALNVEIRFKSVIYYYIFYLRGCGGDGLLLSTRVPASKRRLGVPRTVTINGRPLSLLGANQTIPPEIRGLDTFFVLLR